MLVYDIRIWSVIHGRFCNHCKKVARNGLVFFVSMLCNAASHGLSHPDVFPLGTHDLPQGSIVVCGEDQHPGQLHLCGKWLRAALVGKPKMLFIVNSGVMKDWSFKMFCFGAIFRKVQSSLETNEFYDEFQDETWGNFWWDFCLALMAVSHRGEKPSLRLVRLAVCEANTAIAMGWNEIFSSPGWRSNGIHEWLLVRFNSEWIRSVIVPVDDLATYLSEYLSIIWTLLSTYI